MSRRITNLKEPKRIQSRPPKSMLGGKYLRLQSDDVCGLSDDDDDGTWYGGNFHDTMNII
jgi:hypothetical protein